MKKHIAVAFLVACAFGCADKATTTPLPGGYKVWVMNSEEVYVSDAGNELLVGPLLRKIGVTKRHIVTTSEAAGPGYIGNLRTSGYSLIERSTRKVTTGMTEDEATRKLSQMGESMPALLDFKRYQLVTQ
jgi:hypothetical protein